MNKNFLSIIIAVILIVLVGLLIISFYNGSLANIFSFFNNQKTDTSGIVLFYGDGCPHCKIVDDFIAENKIEEKVKFSRLEIFNNKDNVGILLQKAQSCGMDRNQIIVPFLWDGETCIVGDQNTIKFFQEKIK